MKNTKSQLSDGNIVQKTLTHDKYMANRLYIHDQHLAIDGPPPHCEIHEWYKYDELTQQNYSNQQWYVVGMYECLKCLISRNIVERKGYDTIDSDAFFAQPLNSTK